MFAPMHGVTPSCRKLLNQKLSMTAPPRRPFPFLAFVSLLLLPVLLTPRDAGAQARIKDITDVQGIRDNQLVGYGLVVGLNNTGDSLQNAVFTKQSLVGMLGRLSINTQALASQLQTKDVAAVMVTADLPAFIRTGERIDVTASAMGDAKDLTGGTLLVTPLLGADGRVYAVAQGSLVIPAPSPPPVPTAASRRACPPSAGSPMAAWWNARSISPSPPRPIPACSSATRTSPRRSASPAPSTTRWAMTWPRRRPAHHQSQPRRAGRGAIARRHRGSGGHPLLARNRGRR
jgi:hypothetical protein